MTEAMKPLERLLAILDGRETDRAASITPTSVATVESMEQTGASFPEVHTNAEKMAALAAAGHELLGFDSVAPYYSVQQEAAALGCRVDWGTQGTMPTNAAPIYEEPGAFKMPRDFLSRLPVKTVIDAVRILKKQYGDGVVVIGKVMGPWTLSYHLHGVQDFLLETISNPEQVRGFLEAFKEISLKFALAQIEAGADVITWADHATGDLVSAKTYADFLLPVQRDCMKRLRALMPRRVPVILHTCGRTLDRVEYFEQAGFDAFHFDSKNGPREMAERTGKLALTGCVNNPSVLLKGSCEDVAAQVREILAAGVRLVSPECAVPCRVRNENLRAITQTVIEAARP